MSLLQVRELPQRARLAGVIAPAHRVTAFGERDDGAASGAIRRFKGGGFFSLFEIVLIRANEDDHLRFDVITALTAILPTFFMAFAVVLAAGMPMRPLGSTTGGGLSRCGSTRSRHGGTAPFPPVSPAVGVWSPPFGPPDPKTGSLLQRSWPRYFAAGKLRPRMSLTSLTTTGIIGIGLMGSAVMKRTGAACGWDLDAARCVNATTADDVFGRCEVVFLCLPNSKIVREVLRSATLKHGLIVIDTTTGDPAEMAALGVTLAEQGIHYLDATISGSSDQLAAGDVLVMAGGDVNVFERCRELFAKFASDAVHTGPCGSGAKMKLITNLVLGLNRAALAEGLVFANELGVEGKQALDVLRRSMAYSSIMDTKGEKMLARDFTPQAKLSQHLKDVRLILAASSIPLPLSETHRALLEKAETLGFGGADNSAVIEAISNP